MKTLGLQNEKIGIIGNGSWGTAIAKILTDNGVKVNWWIRNIVSLEHLKLRWHNPHYLTSVRFMPDSIIPTGNLEQLLGECGIIIVAVPSAYIQNIINLTNKELWQNRVIISTIKGILPECNLLLNDYLEQEFDIHINNYLAITGPCHAEEVAEERLSYLTFSGLDDRLTCSIAKIFRNNYIKTTTNHDIWGVQLASVLKNIYAIGTGIARSLDYGDNFLSVYITNCYREMYHFLVDHFNKVNPLDKMPDFHTSAYLGDLLVTCYSLHSRNRTFGAMIGKGYSVKAATLEMNMVAEGYYGARGMEFISKKYEIVNPIASKIYSILWEEHSAVESFREIEKMLS